MQHIANAFLFSWFWFNQGHGFPRQIAWGSRNASLVGSFCFWVITCRMRIDNVIIEDWFRSEYRPWHWLCACWSACLFEAVGPVRATTIYFPLARGAGFLPPLFLLGIGKTRKATLIRTYFSLYIGLMYKSVQLHAWNHKFLPRKHLGHYMFLGGPVGFLRG